MSKNEADEIKTTIERIGTRVSESGEIKKITYVESVDEEGRVHKTTEVDKGLNDCGHVGEAGAVCQVCEAFTICDSCVKTERFVCCSCRRICCPRCSRESLFHPGVRFCHRCGFKGLIREALKESK